MKKLILFIILLTLNQASFAREIFLDEQPLFCGLMKSKVYVAYVTDTGQFSHVFTCLQLNTGSHMTNEEDVRFLTKTIEQKEQKSINILEFLPLSN